MQRLILIFLFLAVSACDSGGGDTKDKEPDPNQPLPVYTVTQINDYGAYSETTTHEVESGSVFNYQPLGLIELFPDIVTFDGITGCGGFIVSPTMTSDDNYASAPITSNCIATAQFNLLASEGVVIDTTQPESGATMFPAAITVAAGSDAAFKITGQPSYDIDVDGCNGVLSDDMIYHIESVENNCTVHLSATLTTDDIVTVDVSTNVPGMIKPEYIETKRGESVAFEVKRGLNINAYVSGCDGSLGEEPFSYNEPYIYTTGSVDTDCTIEAHFEPKEPVGTVVLASVEGAGNIYSRLIMGSILSTPLEPDYPYLNIQTPEDSHLNLTSQADYGKTATSVTGCMGEISTEESLLLDVDLSDQDCKPVFEFNDADEIREALVTISHSGPGTVTPEAIVAFDGTSLILNAEPNPGYMPIILPCQTGVRGKWTHIVDGIYASNPLYDQVGCEIQVEFVPDN